MNLEIFVILTVALATSSAYGDAMAVNYECYHGSVRLCDGLRMLHEYSFGFYGFIAMLLVLFLWKVCEQI